jgi:hypothetical protein
MEKIAVTAFAAVITTVHVSFWMNYLAESSGTTGRRSGAHS